MSRGSALLFSIITFLAACGSDANGTSDSPTDGSNGASGGQGPGGSSGAPDGQGDPNIVGLWEVSGTDARGAYTGEVEIRDEAGGYRFIRSVRYPTVKVEGGRDLHWLFRGTLAKTGTTIKLTSSLKRADFVSERGTLKRTIADTPLAVTGELVFAQKQGEISGTITATGISLGDTWKSKKPLPAKPIFVDERKYVASHDPPSASTKSSQFALYKDYHSLDIIKPYVNRPEFQAAVHRHIVDPTDLDFYRANKNALRVVDKPIDDISLAETVARADAYRFSIAEKAKKYDDDIETRFLDPSVGMLPDGGAIGSTLGQWYPSGDGALWTGVYLASQVFRFEVTGEEQARTNVTITLDALLKLQEITGDFSQFARTLRKSTATPASPPWHTGTGAFAGLDWLGGGNNDMIKGLFYGYLMGWQLLCEGGKTGYASLCSRIRTNAKHLVDDVKLGGSNAPASQISNDLPASWLYAIVSDNIGDTIKYRGIAEGHWAGMKEVLKQTPVMYMQGTVDWSGQHLTSIGDMIGIFEAKRLNLGSDAMLGYQAHVDASHKNLEKQRFPNWHLLKAAFGTGASPSSPFIKEAVSRLSEMRYPKTSWIIDHRIAADFCMSPYPAVPWKNDWMKYPQEDRTQSLDAHPLFELGPDIMSWKIGRDYRSWPNYEVPAPDYLHLYWFARRYGLLTAND